MAANPPPIASSKPLKNKTQLQSTLTLSITSITPSTISLSRLTTNPTISLTLTARQTWSRHPSKPLTLCTWRNALNTANPALEYAHAALPSHIHLASTTSNKILYPEPRLAPSMLIHWSFPAERDYRTQLGFVTIPALDSDTTLSITQDIDVSHLVATLRGGGVDEVPIVTPDVGEAFRVRLDDKGEFFCFWWNWGDLEGDLKDKKFVTLPDPSISGRSEEENRLGEEWVQAFGWGERMRDGEGGNFVWLEGVVEGEGVEVVFVE